AAHPWRILQNSDLDCGRLVYAHRIVIGEVRLLHPAIPKGDLLAHCRGEAENDAGLHLALDDARVERGANIGGAPNLLDADRVAFERDLSHLGHPRPE